MSYSEIVWEHFNEPRNQGRLASPDATGHAGGERGGPFMRLTARLRGECLEELRFETHGCAPSVAAGSVLTESLRGRPVKEACAWTTDRLVEELGGLPRSKVHCAALAIEALQALILEVVEVYRRRGEEAGADVGAYARTSELEGTE